ncbi:MAG: hypothetical protein BJ554DRAFT_6938 [Olpidium bornovanus]|uniref:Uncharacterized protein n=1 Tax=Olpidium bornovanus TaxID=278681 RepID=A0A8H7ZXF8_9FUNG|nr:MAG: hypothetical protein BJ554DRAFT_6938 [Olpidium bornovanus]
MQGYYDPSSYVQGQATPSGFGQNRENENSTSESGPTGSAQGVGSLNATVPGLPQQTQQGYGLPGQPYYPYYYLPSQFPHAAYQQSGYGQPYGNKSMYPMYGGHQHLGAHQHPQGSKPSPGSPYSGYPSSGAGSNTVAAAGYGQQKYDATGYAQSQMVGGHPGQHQLADYKGYGSQFSQLPNFLSMQHQSSQVAGTGVTSAAHIPKPGDGNAVPMSKPSGSYDKYGDQAVGKGGPVQQSVAATTDLQPPQQQGQHVQQPGVSQQPHQQPQPQQPQQQQQLPNYYQPSPYGEYYAPQTGYGRPFPQQQQHYVGARSVSRPAARVVREVMIGAGPSVGTGLRARTMAPGKMIGDMPTTKRSAGWNQVWGGGHS